MPDEADEAGAPCRQLKATRKMPSSRLCVQWPWTSESPERDMYSMVWESSLPCVFSMMVPAPYVSEMYLYTWVVFKTGVSLRQRSDGMTTRRRRGAGSVRQSKRPNISNITECECVLAQKDPKQHETRASSFWVRR